MADSPGGGSRPSQTEAPAHAISHHMKSEMEKKKDGATRLFILWAVKEDYWVVNHRYRNPFWKYKEKVAWWYTKDQTQGFVAFLIMANFFAQCVQRSYYPVNGGEPSDEQAGEVWKRIYFVFNLIWLIELLLNMYGTWYCLPADGFFWIRSFWNQFDCVVVTLGVVDMCRITYPGTLKLLRMLRVFRIFRLFARIEDLQRIVTTLIIAVPGIWNSFVILLILMSMYAVLAVDTIGSWVYREQGDDARGRAGFDYYPNEAGNWTRSCSLSDPVSAAGSGNCYGWEYYGSFFQAMYTLFQVMTGDAWSEMGVRPILYNKLAWPSQKACRRLDDKDASAVPSECQALHDGELVPGAWVHGPDVGTSVVIMLFFITFVVVTNFVMLNVVVTVLLDKFQNAPAFQQIKNDQSFLGYGAKDDDDDVIESRMEEEERSLTIESLATTADNTSPNLDQRDSIEVFTIKEFKNMQRSVSAEMDAMQAAVEEMLEELRKR